MLQLLVSLVRSLGGGDYLIVAAIEDDRFVVLVVTAGHRCEVYR